MRRPQLTVWPRSETSRLRCLLVLVLLTLNHLFHIHNQVYQEIKDSAQDLRRWMMTTTSLTSRSATASNDLNKRDKLFEATDKLDVLRNPIRSNPSKSKISGQDHPRHASTIPGAKTFANVNRQNSKRASARKIREIQDDFMVVSGYWKLDQNTKNSVQHYCNSVNMTLQYFSESNFTVQFFHNVDFFLNNDKDDTILNKNLSKQSSCFAPMFRHYRKIAKNIHFRYMKTDQLLLSEAKSLVTLCQAQSTPVLANPRSAPNKDKNFLHHRRMLESTTSVWTQVVAIWITKFRLLKHVIQRHPNKHYFAWIDAGLKQRIPRGLARFQNNAYTNYSIVRFRRSNLDLSGIPVYVAAGIILSHRDSFLTFIDHFYQEVDHLVTANSTTSIKLFREFLCHDEETIITRMLNRRPELRSTVGPLHMPQYLDAHPLPRLVRQDQQTKSKRMRFS